MATVHLICGPTGAGKTTFARKLAGERGAVRFSIDEWMANLFERDAPDPIVFDWAWERVRRCETQIWQICLQLLAAGTDVILDHGFTTRNHRERFYRWAADAGADAACHHVTAGRDARLDRVRRRNLDRSEVFAFTVSDAMFEFMEARFEAPTAGEAAFVARNDDQV